MCCFSRPVESVANTNIFARDAEGGRQFLVYSMTLTTNEDLAMILPIPTPRAAPEDAVRFINLEGYPNFFNDLNRGFGRIVPRGLRKGSKGAVSAEPKLRVVAVGSFEASFVPTIADFDRLDERFRLPTAVWKQLPGYRDWGFAVFKLQAGERKIHPMAFEFPRADPHWLFFPTLHVHDGQVDGRARFDHALYCQFQTERAKRWSAVLKPVRALQKLAAAIRLKAAWDVSFIPTAQFMRIDCCQGLLDPDGLCYRREMQGTYRNADVYV
ncbi:MAG: hypothetical protein JNM56_32185 [Planctomycetia bacterium]|nr:hypothetical protein [Planctomycetia bacterium]